jgi:hypothetical protein
MIYSVGLNIRYGPALASGQKVIKQGRGVDAKGKPYPGGFVFETVEDARRFLDAKGLAATHTIFGVLADWDRDTEEAPGEPFRRLTRDAEVVRL